MADDRSHRTVATTVIVTVLFAITFGILGGAGFLARKNLRSGRGDLQGATRLGVCMTAVLMALWVCKVHLVGSSASSRCS